MNMHLLYSCWKYGREDSGVQYFLYDGGPLGKYFIICSYLGEVGNVWYFDTRAEADDVIDNLMHI